LERQGKAMMQIGRRGVYIIKVRGIEKHRVITCYKGAHVLKLPVCEIWWRMAGDATLFFRYFVSQFVVCPFVQNFATKLHGIELSGRIVKQIRRIGYSGYNIGNQG